MDIFIILTIVFMIGWGVCFLMSIIKRKAPESETWFTISWLCLLLMNLMTLLYKMIR